ncbi:hypothetical protein GCM10009560_55890 [Nonomuraea longicatena]|uniref:Uncharacterized protein n=1 Tax=Nonomuraea longicatena TaxID=83682 RepID=A0ABN1QHT7_9ACTN
MDLGETKGTVARQLGATIAGVELATPLAWIPPEPAPRRLPSAPLNRFPVADGRDPVGALGWPAGRRGGGMRERSRGAGEAVSGDGGRRVGAASAVTDGGRP